MKWSEVNVKGIIVWCWATTDIFDLMSEGGSSASWPWAQWAKHNWNCEKRGGTAVYTLKGEQGCEVLGRKFDLLLSVWNQVKLTAALRTCGAGICMSVRLRSSLLLTGSHTSLIKKRGKGAETVCTAHWKLCLIRDLHNKEADLFSVSELTQSFHM